MKKLVYDFCPLIVGIVLMIGLIVGIPVSVVTLQERLVNTYYLQDPTSQEICILKCLSVKDNKVCSINLEYKTVDTLEIQVYARIFDHNYTRDRLTELVPRLRKGSEFYECVDCSDK